MSIDERYNNLLNKIVNDINGSGLPMCCIKDILQGLFVEAQQKYNYKIQIVQQSDLESKTSMDPITRPSEDLPAEEMAAQSAEPEAATAETVPTGKEDPHA